MIYLESYYCSVLHPPSFNEHLGLLESGVVETLLLVERTDGIHLCLRECEVHCADVLDNVVMLRAAWYDRETLLNMPADDDLGKKSCRELSLSAVAQVP